MSSETVSPALDAARQAANPTPLARAREALAKAQRMDALAQSAEYVHQSKPYERDRDRELTFAATSALVSIAESLTEIAQNTRRPGGGPL